LLVDTARCQDQEEQGQKQNEGGESCFIFVSWPVGEVELTTRAMALKALDARLASSPTPTPAPATAPGAGPSTSPTTATVPIPPTLNKAVSSKAVPQVEDKAEKVKD
jgi:hypothetical protein